MSSFTVTTVLSEILGFFFYDHGFVGALIGFGLGTAFWISIAVVAISSFALCRWMWARIFAPIAQTQAQFSNLCNDISSISSNVAAQSRFAQDCSHKQEPANGGGGGDGGSSYSWCLPLLAAVSPLLLGLARGYLDRPREPTRQGPGFGGVLASPQARTCSDTSSERTAAETTPTASSQSRQAGTPRRGGSGRRSRRRIRRPRRSVLIRGARWTLRGRTLERGRGVARAASA